MDRRNRQTADASPAEPGGLPLMLAAGGYKRESAFGWPDETQLLLAGRLPQDVAEYIEMLGRRGGQLRYS